MSQVFVPILICVSSCKLGKSCYVQPQVNGIPSNIRLAIVSPRSDVCGASNSTWSDTLIESTSTPIAYGMGFSTSDDTFFVAEMLQNGW